MTETPFETGSADGGTPLRVRFGGIMEGRCRDRRAVEDAALEVEAVGIASANLEVEGGRFSLMLDDEEIEGERASPQRLELLVERLNDLSRASGAPESVESTLNLTEVFPDSVRETVFAARDGNIVPVSRVRRTNGAPPSLDRPRKAGAMRRVGMQRVALVVALLLVAFGLTAWQSGYLGRIFSASAGELHVDTGPFGTDLRVSVGKSWGSYVVTLQRGKTFPRTEDDVSRQRKATKSLTRSAAIDAVARGGQVFVQLLDSRSKVLESRPVRLTPLLGGEKGKATVKLPGRLAADSIRLAMDDGR